VAWTRSASERRWWTLALVYLAGIYLSLYPLQFALDFLRTRNLLRLTMGALFVVAGAAVVAAMARRRATRLEWLVLGAIGATYLLLLSRMTIIQERLHLLEYGLLALAFREALVARAAASPGGTAARPARTAAGALGLTALAGWVDEGIQGILPNRVYDLRDVGFNALAAAIALAAAAALGWAARRAGRSHGSA
jgi:hypothetical protein